MFLPHLSLAGVQDNPNGQTAQKCLRIHRRVFPTLGREIQPCVPPNLQCLIRPPLSWNRTGEL